MSVRLTFNAMKSVSSEIFGLDLVRHGKQFKLLEEGVALGEGHGDLWTLKGIREMYQECLRNPDPSMFVPKVREALMA